MLSMSTCVESIDDPNRVVSRVRGLLARAGSEKRAILHAYVLPGDVLSIGRFHVVPDAPRSPVLRRLGGGRAAPMGRGYVGIALALPHRSALVAEDPGALAPAQVLNRAVRGLLAALAELGVRAGYPGRDLVTVERRVLAALGFDVAPTGATLVEMAIAYTRSYACVMEIADRADPAGVVPLELVLPEGATSIAAERGAAPDLDAFVAALARGFAARLDVRVLAEPEPLPPADPDGSWLASGVMAPPPLRGATRRTMLGVAQAFVGTADGRVTEVRLRGDFIAPSATIERLEVAFRGVPVDRTALAACVREAVSPADFVLGVPGFDTFAELVHEAAAS